MNNNTELEDDIEYLNIDLDEKTQDDDLGFIVGGDITEIRDEEKPVVIDEAEKKRILKKDIITYVCIVIGAVLIAFIVNKFIIINAHVPSSSMEDTIYTNDKLIGNRLAYLFKDPQRGDIIIFKFPDDEKEIYIKRVIGVPGDIVQIVDGVLLINDEVYEEPYIKMEMYGNFGPYVVPQDRYFVLGDNRNVSQDSRYWIHTYVKRSQILAKAWFRYSPSFSKVK